MSKIELKQNQFYIDKTEELQKGIEGFPFVYIEGFAACGKSTAVKMLLDKYPEVEHYVVDMNSNKDAEKLKVTFHILRSWMREDGGFIIIENMNEALPKDSAQLFKEFLAVFSIEYSKDAKVIFVGRARPDECLLPFVWKRQMEIIHQEALMFSQSEIQKMISEMGCDVSAKDIYEQTGGWAGCVDMMLRLAKRQEKYGENIIDAKDIRRSYEIEQYIQYTIMDALDAEEKEFLRKCIVAPWVDVRMCQEFFEMENDQELLDKLRRKGIFKYDAYQKNWKVLEAFQGQKHWEDAQNWKQMSAWYAEAGYIHEATICVRNAQDEEAHLDFLQKYYAQIALSDIPGEMILSKIRVTPEMCYLQGVYNYLHQDFRGLDREIIRLEKMEVADTHLKQEILLNLYYLKPDFILGDWMNLLVKYGEIKSEEMKQGNVASERKQKFQIYHILGYSHTYLCGLRDLTGLFACTKKEENQNARVWKTFLGEKEWKCYQLAKIDYYLETERKDKISEDDWNIFYGEEDNRLDRVRLYLAGKLVKMYPTDEHEEHFTKLCAQMKGQPDEANVTNSIIRLYSRWTKESHLMAYWLRYSEKAIYTDINELNYAEICFMMKGYLQLKQFEKVERILKKMIPYLQKYHRTRLLAEILFQQAVVKWEMGRHGQALQNVIESFLVGAPYRYVGFYANYGVAGKEVLEAYEEWCRTNLPEKWRHKKKYQYGNVLRMPEADYVGVILRLAHKERFAGQKNNIAADEIAAERLTMMETMVLQAIGRGCSNQQICEELNLKLPTVKTHVYSMYKKLGVSGRVQAVNKGKEMGVV